MSLSGALPRPVEVAGRPASSDPRERLQAGIRRVIPGYADAVRLRLLAGGFFAEGDDDPRAVVFVLRDALADIYPRAVVTTTVLDTGLSADTAQSRLYALCGSVFGAVAVLLAAFGLYSLLSYYGVTTAA